MIDFSINEMLIMQKELQEKYRNKWEAITPDAGKHKFELVEKGQMPFLTKT